MRKKIKNEIKEMVANVDWANVAPDNDNNNTMAYLFPTEVPSNRAGVAKAVLTCRPDSHPFQERTLQLQQSVKVGRAVAKIKAAPDNAIFDCKVLSRHHATLWYNNGHFFLQDTKSSNGTFVNNHRLSEGCKESSPYEVCSGDIVQFGVDVLENSCSVTHGCIVATLRLYLPDGKEAKACQSSILKSPTPIEDLFILNNILQEAVQREQLLEGKLVRLQGVVECCAGALAQAWRALCSEERLVARVHFLERRLQAAGASTQAAQELQLLVEDKHQYEINATEALRVAHEDKLKLLNQLDSIQWSVCSSEEECAVLRGHVERAHRDLQDLGEKKSLAEKELQISKEALQEARRQVANYELILISDLISCRDEKYGTENGYGEEVVENKADTVSLELLWEKLSKGDHKELSMMDAIRDLRDQIKLLSKFKTASTAEQEQEVELKHELWKLENKQSDDNANDNPLRGDAPALIEPTDANKENSNYTSSEDSPKVSLGADEEQDKRDVSLQDVKEGDNHNETVLDGNSILGKVGEEETKDMLTKLLRDKIHEITEQHNSSTENGLQFKLVMYQKKLTYAGRCIAELTRDLEMAAGELKRAVADVVELTHAKRKLALEVYDMKLNLSKKTEECSKLEKMLSQSLVEEREKTDENESSKYKEEVTQLRKKLEEVFRAESDSCELIERLKLRILDLQDEVRDSSLASQVDALKKQLHSKESRIEDLTQQVALLIDIQVRLEEKVNSATLDSSVCSPESQAPLLSKDTLVAEADSRRTSVFPKEKSTSPIVLSTSLAAAEYIYGHEGDLLPAEVSIDHKRLAALEEELVMSKERCALVAEDNCRLAARVQVLESSSPLVAPRVDRLLYAVPIAAVLLYLLMYQYVS